MSDFLHDPCDPGSSAIFQQWCHYRIPPNRQKGMFHTQCQWFCRVCCSIHCLHAGIDNVIQSSFSLDRREHSTHHVWRPTSSAQSGKKTGNVIPLWVTWNSPKIALETEKRNETLTWEQKFDLRPCSCIEGKDDQTLQNSFGRSIWMKQKWARMDILLQAHACSCCGYLFQVLTRTCCLTWLGAMAEGGATPPVASSSGSSSSEVRAVSCGRVGSSHACNPAFGRGAEYRWSHFSGAARSWSCAPDSQLEPPI